MRTAIFLLSLCFFGCAGTGQPGGPDRVRARPVDVLELGPAASDQMEVALNAYHGGDWQAARTGFSRLRDLARNRPGQAPVVDLLDQLLADTGYREAEALARSGQTEAARARLANALVHDPSHEAAWTLFQRLGSPASARK